MLLIPQPFVIIKCYLIVTLGNNSNILWILFFNYKVQLTANHHSQMSEHASVIRTYSEFTYDEAENRDKSCVLPLY